MDEKELEKLNQDINDLKNGIEELKNKEIDTSKIDSQLANQKIENEIIKNTLEEIKANIQTNPKAEKNEYFDCFSGSFKEREEN